MEDKHARFVTFAWFSVGYNLLVILWGAWVRISGSGAGCGSHWPTCHGEVVPPDASTATMIELFHRATSGLSLIVMVIVVVWAYRAFPKKHRVRVGATTAGIFLILEALLGAGLVIFELVADDDSMARAIVIALHLVNTLALVGFGALTAWWAGGGPAPKWANTGIQRWLFVAALVGMVITCMAGAITALGDTLFPIDPLAGEGLVDRIRGDLSAGEHFLVRLRIVHPVLATLMGFYLLGWTTILQWRDETSESVQRWAKAVAALVIVQIAAGLLNVYLAAPGWMQLVHLLLADIMWIAIIILGVAALASTKTTSTMATA